jgi:hypothetical protein
MMLFARDVMRGGNYGAHRSRECDSAGALGGQIAGVWMIVWVRRNLRCRNISSPAEAGEENTLCLCPR